MAGKRKLTYFISSLDIGGAQWGLIRLLRKLTPEEFDITVVALQTKEQALKAEMPGHVSFVDLNVSPRFRLDRLLPLQDILRDTDILVCSLYHATIAGRILGHLYSVPTVLNWKHNGRFRSRGRRLLYLITNPLTDGVLADSEYVARVMRDSAKIPVYEVPIAGIDTDQFEQVDHSGTDDIVVGTLGTLRWEKQHERVLDVAENLPSINFYIGGDGPLHIPLKKEIDSRELHNVELLGQIEDVSGFLNELDIYFQPSLSEGLCITVIEAMAAGLPVVASDIGGISDSVVLGETGYLRSPMDTEGFVKDIRELSIRPDLRSKFGQNSRSRALTKFSDEVLRRSFVEALDAATGRD